MEIQPAGENLADSVERVTQRIVEVAAGTDTIAYPHGPTDAYAVPVRAIG